MVPQIYILSTIGNSISEIINTNDTPPSIMEIIFLPKIYLPILGFIVLFCFQSQLEKKYLKKVDKLWCWRTGLEPDNLCITNALHPPSCCSSILLPY